MHINYPNQFANSTRQRNFRLLLIFLSITITSFSLNQFAKLIQPLLSIHYDWRFELGMVLGQLVFQFPFLWKQPFANKLLYYFNMLMVSLLGSLLLLPLLAVNLFFHTSYVISLVYFFSVVLVMFLNHKHRVANIGLPTFLSYTWVLYRCIILLFII